MIAKESHIFPTRLTISRFSDKNQHLFIILTFNILSEHELTTSFISKNTPQVCAGPGSQESSNT